MTTEFQNESKKRENGTTCDKKIGGGDEVTAVA